MKILVFHIGRERYALPLAQVDRVLPVARLTPLPGAPAYVRGLLDLHGEPVPVIDLSLLAGAPPDAVRYDTRILLVTVPAAGRLRRLGMKAERVTGVATMPGAPADAGVAAAPWLGQVVPGAAEDDGGHHGSHDGSGGGMLQLVRPEHLLAPGVASLLFGEAA